jgi:glutamate synthase (ferredoxin)
VIVLGPTGRNFAAGMSGGIAYVLDEAGDFHTRCNLQMVTLQTLAMEDEETEGIRRMIQRHAEYTQSQRAWKILALWKAMAPLFVKIMPKDFQRVLEAMKRVTEAGLSGEEAIMAAFEENTKDAARIGGG